MSVDLGDFDPYDLARRLHRWGSENVAFDALMALGPVVVLALVVGGRNPVTTTIAAAYVTGFLAALAYNVATGDGG